MNIDDAVRTGIDYKKEMDLDFSFILIKSAIDDMTTLRAKLHSESKLTPDISWKIDKVLEILEKLIKEV